ncbi:hypothetical protein DFJ74DRAFT_670408 [Hyaloraphidium curvatum]|nr:hypothetical protein DFJ74DRAFT_670408 [Hyaloraphidium curvatum]
MSPDRSVLAGRAPRRVHPRASDRVARNRAARHPRRLASHDAVSTRDRPRTRAPGHPQNAKNPINAQVRSNTAAARAKSTILAVSCTSAAGPTGAKRRMPRAAAFEASCARKRRGTSAEVSLTGSFPCCPSAATPFVPSTSTMIASAHAMHARVCRPESTHSTRAIAQIGWRKSAAGSLARARASAIAAAALLMAQTRTVSVGARMFGPAGAAIARAVPRVAAELGVSGKILELNLPFASAELTAFSRSEGVWRLRAGYEPGRIAGAKGLREAP